MVVKKLNGFSWQFWTAFLEAEGCRKLLFACVVVRQNVNGAPTAFSYKMLIRNTTAGIRGDSDRIMHLLILRDE